MPLGSKPECTKCKSIMTPMWSKTDNGDILCNSCHTEGGRSSIEQNQVKNGSGGKSAATRKSSRAGRSNKSKPSAPAKTAPSKGKGRRIIFKKSATKAPTAVASPVTSKYVFYKGSYYQVGDVVSMVDVDGDLYYAQIRGLLQDQYCQKSAVITWLLPTQSSPPPESGFDPATYIIGPEEEIPRKLECMEFVLHAPSEYFYAKNSPYPTTTTKCDSSFIWTRLGPQIRPIKRDDDVFAVN